MAAHFGGDLASTLIAKPQVHVVSVVNHVNKLLHSYSC